MVISPGGKSHLYPCLKNVCFIPTSHLPLTPTSTHTQVPLLEGFLSVLQSLACSHLLGVSSWFPRRVLKQSSLFCLCEQNSGHLLKSSLLPSSHPKGWCSSGQNLEASWDPSILLLPHSLRPNKAFIHQSFRYIFSLFLYFIETESHVSSLASEFPL